MECSPNLSTREIVPFDNYQYVEDVANVDRFNLQIASFDESSSTANKSKTTVHSRCIVVNNIPVKYIRRLKNFIYCDVFATSVKHLFLKDKDELSNFFVLFGELQPIYYEKPNASSQQYPSQNVKIIVIDVALFYGTGPKDPLRGIWVEDLEGSWYQLVAPCHHEYQNIWDNISSKLFPTHYSNKGNYGKDQIWNVNKVSIYNNTTGNYADLLQLPLPPKVLKQLDGKRGDKDDMINDEMTLHGHISIVLDADSSVEVKMIIGLAEYEVCFGGSVSSPQADNDRGIWVRGCDSTIWYKIMDASVPYETHYNSIQERSFGTKQSIGSYDIRSNYYRDILRRLTYTVLLNEHGKSVPYIFHHKDNDGSSRFFLRGYAMPKEDAAEMLPICVSAFVGDYVVDLGRKNNPEPSMYLKSSHFKTWYRIDPKCWSEKCIGTNAPSIAHLNNIISSYNWPSETSELWRRIDNFALLDIKGNFGSMLSSCAPNKTSILKGQLLRKSKNAQASSLNVQLYCDQYSIDYGTHVEDENRGLWLKDENEGWYKVLSPHQQYADYAWEALVKTQKFLKIHETLVFDDSSYCHCDENTGLFKCSMTISELFLESKGSFDLGFVLENKEFICNNLEGGFDKSGSKKLFSSINKLTKKEVQRCEDELEAQEYGTVPLTVNIELERDPPREATVSPSVDKSIKKRKSSEPLTVNLSNQNDVQIDIQTNKNGPIPTSSTSAIKKPKPGEVELVLLDESATAVPTPLTTPPPNPTNIMSHDAKDIDASPAAPKIASGAVSVPNKSSEQIKKSTIDINLPNNKIIKKRVIDVAVADQAIKQQVGSTDSSASSKLKLCRYCKKLEKHYMCSNSLHYDGGYYGESKEEIEKRLGNGSTIPSSSPTVSVTEQSPLPRNKGIDNNLCKYCKSLNKSSKCTNQSHQHGQPVRWKVDASDNNVNESDVRPGHQDTSNSSKRSFDKMHEHDHDEEKKMKERYMMKHERRHQKSSTVVNKLIGGQSITSSDGDFTIFTWKNTGPDLSSVPNKSCLKKISSYDVDSIEFAGLSTKSSDNMATSTVSTKKRVRWIEGRGSTGMLGEVILYDNTEIHEDQQQSFTL